MQGDAENPHRRASILHAMCHIRAKSAFSHCSACQCQHDRVIKAINLFGELHVPERNPRLFLP
jgi:hypothetical protein